MSGRRFLRTRGVVVVAVAALVLGGAACTPKVPAPSGPAPAAISVAVSPDPGDDPILFFTDDVADVHITTEFTFTNTGGQVSDWVYFTWESICGMDEPCPPVEWSWGASQTGCPPIAPGESCTIDFAYYPGISELRWDFDILYIYTGDDVVASYDVEALSIPSFTVSPHRPTIQDSVSHVGATSETFVVENWSSAPIGPLDLGINDQGGSGTFSFTNSTCNVAIPDGESCTFDLSFEATTTGDAWMELYITDDALGLWRSVYAGGLGVP